MISKVVAVAASAAIGLFGSASHAGDVATAKAQPELTTIRIAGQDVPVVNGGLYDRFRSNPPLSVIAAETPEVDLSWFRQLKKERVDIGFESYSPNFYYKNSRVTAIFTADLDKLRELMPAKVLEQVQPLQVWPGRGLVALTAYSYRYCDNDSYEEIGLSVVTNKPGSASFGPFTLLRQSMSDDFWGYVLKLPVNTELARVRGVVGYNLPKWLTDIHFRETDSAVVVEIFDSATRQLDVTLETRKLGDLSSEESMVRNSFTNVDRQGQLTTGYSVSRQLSHASSSSADSVKLTLTDGSLSAYIKALKLGKLVKYEYVPLFQGALYAPKPL
ncbi:acetoacetate decarboxylase (ADC) [Roseateles aquatilis]|uniref:acetoacetate decarboxylase (ADC) n=1 Tax=Roseateles aquatilis TaxID=431061 RepID=UPI00192CFB3D|nr:acetoacetate decarboxylase (ADC) [Roseateles aquatilis]MBY0367360.1 acetoacetate decarboxylase (ADC) [Burkholderiaceae bacterium]